MGDEGPAGQEQRYTEAVSAFGPALERLARAYQRDPELRRDLLQDIHIALGPWPLVNRIASPSIAPN